MKGNLFRALLFLAGLGVVPRLVWGKNLADEPVELFQEDLILDKESIEDAIVNTQNLLVLFYDKEDSRMERTSQNIRNAIALLKTSEIDVGFAKFAAPVTPKIEKAYHVYNFPKLVLFSDGKRYPLEQAPYPRQIEAFVKRVVRESQRTVSYKLKDKDTFGNLLEKEGTVVLYCGFGLQDPEFSIFEGVARDAKHVYVYSFDEKICRWVYLRHQGIESQ